MWFRAQTSLIAVLSNKVATSHARLLSTPNAASVAEELVLILLNFHVFET